MFTFGMITFYASFSHDMLIDVSEGSYLNDTFKWCIVAKVLGDMGDTTFSAFMPILHMGLSENKVYSQL